MGAPQEETQKERKRERKKKKRERQRERERRRESERERGREIRTLSSDSPAHVFPGAVVYRLTDKGGYTRKRCAYYHILSHIHTLTHICQLVSSVLVCNGSVVGRWRL